MSAILAAIISVIYWAYVTVSLLVFFPVAVLIFVLSIAFDRQRVLLHLFSCLWGYQYLVFMPLWNVSVSGRHHIRFNRTYMLVANHQSMLDILALYGLFRPFKWVSKQELFRLPVFGWNMSMAGYVQLQRDRKGSITKMMRDCRAELDRGSSIMMFPEGTRSPDGRMRRFREGAFVMAKEAKVEIVPIAVYGTSRALPKGGLLLRSLSRVPMRVHVLPPVSPEAASQPEELAQLCQEMIQKELDAMERAFAEGG
jgi:1-acyl-sn-glycerol-3-phosphate acyltransferase